MESEPFQVTDRQLEALFELNVPRNPNERDAYCQGLQDAAIQVAYAFEGSGPIVERIRARANEIKGTLR